MTYGNSILPCLFLAFLFGCAAAGKAPVSEDLPSPPKPPPVTEQPMPAEDPRAGRQVAEHMPEKDVPGIQQKFLLYLPEGYPGDRTWPLLLFLHGSGERGADIDRVKKHGPPRHLDEDMALPCIVVSPQCPAGETWSVDSLNRFLDRIVSSYPVDRSRIYVTGLSLGGYGTWALAADSAERFAAAAPVCGGGDPSTARAMKELPVWAFHGEKDLLVPVEESREMVEALRKAGGRAKLTVYPDTGHDSWTPTYGNPALYEWLLEQKK